MATVGRSTDPTRWNGAACRSPANIGYFPSANVTMAQLVCNGNPHISQPPCPIRATCLAFGLEHPTDPGVYGGATSTERRAMITRAKRAAKTPNPEVIAPNLPAPTTVSHVPPPPRPEAPAVHYSGTATPAQPLPAPRLELILEHLASPTGKVAVRGLAALDALAIAAGFADGWNSPAAVRFFQGLAMAHVVQVLRFTQTLVLDGEVARSKLARGPNLDNVGRGRNSTLHPAETEITYPPHPGAIPETDLGPYLHLVQALDDYVLSPPARKRLPFQLDWLSIILAPVVTAGGELIGRSNEDLVDDLGLGTSYANFLLQQLDHEGYLQRPRISPRVGRSCMRLTRRGLMWIATYRPDLLPAVDLRRSA